MDRRPAAEELDKKSELTNKLYNDLSAKIDDVDSSREKETKSTRAQLDKILKDVKSTQSKCEDISLKEIKVLREELSELKTGNKQLAATRTDCDKNTKDISTFKMKLDEMKKEVTSTKAESSSLSNKVEKLAMLEKEFEQIKRDKTADKFTSIEKDVASLRADHEKLNKDVKSLSTEVKYVDSSIKKEAANTKNEMSSFSKTIKDFEKDLNTIHNMIDVLNCDKTNSVANDDFNKIKSDLTRTSKENLDKIKQVEDTITKKINADVKEVDSKIQKLKDDLASKMMAVDRKVDSNSKGVDITEVNKLIKTSKDDITVVIDNKVKKCQEDIKKSCVSDLQTKITKQEDIVTKLQKNVDALETSNKLSKIYHKLFFHSNTFILVDKTGDEVKKEVEKINLTVKENIKTLESKLNLQEKSLEGKISKQESQIIEFKTNIKDLKAEGQKTPKQGKDRFMLIKF